jgi:parallel beta-helix repeat protein
MWREKMKKRFFVTILVALLVLVAPFGTQHAKSSGTTLTVPDDYLTIQAAINASNPGDTIFVRAGTYNEHLIVGKSVSLIGESVLRTVISGSNVGGTVVRIVSDGVNVTGLTIRDSQVGQEGIRLDNSSRCNVFGNWVLNNWYGIYLRNSSFCNVSANNVTNDKDGIHLEFSSHNNSIARNSVTASAFYGIHLISSSNNTVVENSVANILYGIYLDGSAYNEVTKNNATYDRYGLYVDGSSNNTVIANNIVGNNQVGIFLDGHSDNNTLYTNNLIGNAQQVGSNGGQKNIWDNGSKGNYWSDYQAKYPNATEIDGSGVWNIAYSIDANNTDNHPLTNYTAIPEFMPATFSLAFMLVIFTIVIAFQRRRHALRNN